MAMQTLNFRAHQAGASLLEVLIAVLVLAVGMLGMAALQAVTLRNSGSAASRSQAAIQTYSMFDRLRLNREVAADGGYNVGWTCAAAASADGGPDYSLFNSWLDDVQGVLGPTACGRIQCGENECTVGVRWDDSRGTGGNPGEPLEIEATSKL